MLQPQLPRARADGEALRLQDAMAAAAVTRRSERRGSASPAGVHVGHVGRHARRVGRAARGGSVAAVQAEIPLARAEKGLCE